MSGESREPSYPRIISGSLLVLAAVALGGALYFMRPVLVPLVLALLLSHLVLPVVDFVQRRLRVPRALAVAAAFILAAGAALLMVLLISTSAARLAGKSHLYQEKLVEAGERMLSAGREAGLPLDSESIRSQLAELPVGSLIGSVLNGLVDSASTLFLVLLFVIYLVAGRRRGESKEGIYREIDGRIRRYLGIKVMLSAATGLLVALSLALLGLDLAIVFGVLAFLLNFIPSVGSIVATLLPFPLAIVQFDSTWRITLALLLPGLVQMVIGNVLEPKMMGDSLELHPITVLLALVFWGMLWGIPGMILAAPITAVLKIILDRLELTRPIGQLLAGHLPGR